MADDSELLHLFARTGSQEAFAELVRRHLGLVYNAALRRAGGDSHLAQEAAADVFIALGRKAPELARRPVLTGWLYVSACYAAAKLVRSARRRRAWETEAAIMDENSAAGAEADWSRIRPVLDEVMVRLPNRDREALLLRYFEGLKFTEMADALQLTEGGARLRVQRALDRMRSRLARRGIVSTGAALAAALELQTAAAVPAGLAVAVTSAALGKLASTAGLGATGSSLLKLMMGSKTVVGIVGALVLLSAGAGFYLGHVEVGRAASPGKAGAQGRDGWNPLDGSRTPNKTSALVSLAHGPASAKRSAVDRRPRRATAPDETKAQVLSDLGSGIVRVRALSDVGNATPRAAMESFLWAIDEGSYDDIARMLALTAPQEKQLGTILAGLPAAARDEYPDAEHVVAVFAAYEGTAIPAAGEIQITSETASDAGDVTIVTTVGTIGLIDGADGWKVGVPNSVINMIAGSVAKGAAPGG